MTAMGFVNVDSSGEMEFGFVPCDLDPANIVHPHDPESKRGKDVIDYVQRGCSSQGINGRVDTSSFVEIGGQRGVRIVPIQQT